MQHAKKIMKVYNVPKELLAQTGHNLLYETREAKRRGDEIYMGVKDGKVNDGRGEERGREEKGGEGRRGQRRLNKN